MTDQLWWVRWPSRLEFELAALEAVGIRWCRDEAALARGVMRLDLVVPTNDGDLPLTVIFPDSYPYFRFQLYAPTLSLSYHQNPFERNLCLLGRRTHFWDTSDTVAGLIQRQLPAVIATSRSSDGLSADGNEQPQAEPLSDYYRYEASMILVQSDWSIPVQFSSGHLLIGTTTHGSDRPNVLLRGAVLKVLAEDRTMICQADKGLRDAFSGRTVDGRWARISSPIHESHQGAFLEELFRRRPHLRDARPNHVQDDKWLRLWGVLFPEEIAHRTLGEGWMFVCACDAKRPQPIGPPAPHMNSATPKSKNKGRRK